MPLFQSPLDRSFFRRLQQLKIHTRRSFLGNRQGTHTSLRRGHGLEFSDFRPYTYGDDFRHIDWSAYGRTDRLYVRQFREEQDLNVVCLLDTSRSMFLPEQSDKFSMARNLCVALGYIALTDGDTVSFSFLGQRLTPKFRGSAALHRAMREFENLSYVKSFDFSNEIRATVANIKIPGKCFLISDFMVPLAEVAESISLLLGRNFELSLIQVLAPEELSLSLKPGSYVVEDAETGEEVSLNLSSASITEYAEALARQVSELEAYCRKSEVSHVLVSSKEDFSNLMFSRFPKAGLLR